MKSLAAVSTTQNLRRRAHVCLAACAALAALLGWLIPAIAAPPAAIAATQSTTNPYQAPNTPDPSVAGATTPFTTYQAPEGTLGGGASVVSLTSAPTSEYDTPQGEATGHAYVQLTGTGQSVQWTNDTGQPVSFINVRASIPDSSTGGGITATLDLYVNGTFRQALNMNSIQTWQYEGNNNYNGSDQNPADGDPRDFWDDFNAWVSGAAIPAGATITLQKDSANTASFYWINSIDLWNAPAPLAQPANSISITSCGAVADDTPTNGTAAPGATDSTVDIQNCINEAASQGKIVWIPQGTFYLVGTSSLVAQNVTVEGAGYLYSEIYRDVPLPNNVSLGAAFQCYSCTLQNFHIDSDAMSRDEVDGGGGAEDTTGTNWLINSMWVQHVESTVWASGSGGTDENNFFTDIFADGDNLNNVSLTGTSGTNLTATNNYIRGTGDDGMAINSVAYNGSQTYTAMSGTTMTHNTVLAPWGGKGIGIYGGSGNVVEDNYIADTSRYIGLGVGRFGVNGSDMLGATVSGNVIVRSGGNAYFQGQPALQVGNGGDGQNVGTVNDATVTDNTIINSVYDSVGFSTSTNTDLANNTIVSPWRNGIVISPPYYPAPTGSATITGNTVTGVGSGLSPYSNDSSGFTATLSNNSWQTGGGGGGGSTEGPYGGTPAAVPGTVEAANYDTGGQGVAYNVTSVNGSANSYRSDGVDLETCSDTGCGYDLGWTTSGQWFKYTVNVATAGTYTVSLRVAAPSAVTDALHIANSAGTNLSGSVSLPATGGWQDWSTVTASVTLPAGQQTLTVDQDNAGWNLYTMAFAAAGSGGGGGSGSALTASPSSLSFGSTVTGSTSSAQTVTVSNPNASAVSVSSVAVSGPFSQTNTCGSSIAASGSCTVSVTFAPTAAGAATGSLSVASSAAGSPLTVALSGAATASSSTNLALNQPVTASSSYETYVPGNVTDGNTSTYWESNDGAAYPQTIAVNLGSAQSIGSVTLDLPPATAWATRTQTLSVLGSTNGSTFSQIVGSATYTFNPATGNTVTISLPSGTSAQYVELSFTANSGWQAAQLSEFEVFPGTGGGGSSPNSALTGSPSSLSFASTTIGSTSSAQTVTVSNPNASAVSVSSVAVSGPFSQTNSCGSSIAADGSCTVSVTFAPTATGSASGTLSVASSAPSSPLTVALSGTGASATGTALTASPSSLSFASTTVGSTSSAQTVTVSNPNASAVSVSSVAVSGPFSQTSTCGTSIAANGSCTVSVTFSPTAAGSATGSLSVASNATGSPLTVALSGTGVSSTTDLALNAPVTASSYTQTYVPSNAVDGNTSTYWEATNGAWPATYTVNLGSVQALGSITIDLPPSTAWSTRTQTLSVLGSANDTTFSTLVASATYTWNPSTGNTVTIPLPAGTTDQYVELSFTANSVQNGAQASEILIYP